ncbi:MAG: hypothetical protein ACOCSN_02485 [Halanaeroarchaeum sp.]
MPRPRFTCHACGAAFDAPVQNKWGLYEFRRCPRCGSARTTLAWALDESGPACE